MSLLPFHCDGGQDYGQLRASMANFVHLLLLESWGISVSVIIRQSDCKTYSEQVEHTWTIGADVYILWYQLRVPGKLPHAAAPPKLTTSGQTTIVKSLLSKCVRAVGGNRSTILPGHTSQITCSGDSEDTVVNICASCRVKDECAIRAIIIPHSLFVEILDE